MRGEWPPFIGLRGGWQEDEGKKPLSRGAMLQQLWAKKVKKTLNPTNQPQNPLENQLVAPQVDKPSKDKVENWLNDCPSTCSKLESKAEEVSEENQGDLKELQVEVPIINPVVIRKAIDNAVAGVLDSLTPKSRNKRKIIYHEAVDEGEAGHRGEPVEAVAADNADPFEDLFSTPKKRKAPELYIPDPAVIHPQEALVEDEDPTVQHIQFHDGDVGGVVFLGPQGCTYWEHTLLTTTYWVAPQMGQIVMLRSKTDILTVDAVHHIRQYMEKKSDQFLVAPIITFRGEQVLTMDRLANHKSGDTFILFEEVVPPEYASHAGRLYECSVCSKSFTCKKNVSKGCKKGRPHKMLFGEILGKEKVKTWGSNLDRYTVPYGCPPGHKGTGGLTIKREAQGTQQSVQQDALPGGSRARGPIPTEPSIPRTPTRGPSRKHPGTSSTPSNPSVSGPRLSRGWWKGDSKII